MARALRDLDRLARVEYAQGIDRLVRDPEVGRPGTDLASRRLGRLVGIEIKRPFSRPVARRPGTPSPTRARREWHLKREAGFQKSVGELHRSPQLAIVDHLADSYADEFNQGQRLNLYATAQDLHYELGWFRQLSVWAHPHLCGDRSVFAQLQRALSDAGAAGVDVNVATGIVRLVVLAVPDLPQKVAVAFALFLIRMGARRYCHWAGNLRRKDERHPEDRCIR